MEEQNIFPEELKQKFNEFPLYSQEDKGDKAKVIAHWFLGGCDWWATEGSPIKDEPNNFQFFGVVDLGCGAEYGYFQLAEIDQEFNVKVNINGKLAIAPMRVERDEYWNEKTVEELNIQHWD